MSWHFAVLSSEAKIWTQVAEDRVQSLALSSAVFQSRVFINDSSSKPSLNVKKSYGDIFTRLGTIWLPSNQVQTFVGVGVDVLSVVSCLHMKSELSVVTLWPKSFTS